MPERGLEFARTIRSIPYLHWPESTLLFRLQLILEVQTLMKKHLSIFCLGTVFLLAAAAAHAQVVSFSNVSLTGNQEVPPTGSPATGITTVTLDQNASTLAINFNWSGLTGTTTAAHIHCCAAPGINAQVATTTPFFTGFPTGVTAGTFAITLDLNAAGSYNPAFVTAHGGTVAQAKADLIAGIIGGQSYLNIHTNVFPGGEIRALLLDTTAPTITCAAGTTKFTDSGQNAATFLPTPPVATDNVYLLSVVGVRSDGQPLNAPFQLGVTTIVWTARDLAGNLASCGQAIAVMIPAGTDHHKH